ncbi:MAG: glutamate-cysteine ligase family protein [Methanoregula sp.]|jgi:gamma-glutamyl:cysteine ligase YbdK (ATP-grasp superfamily)|uniref:glutamate-cysteine ligase family protein n=1 Tax=Methanoregula sp. TaxID=2052170 RepID=UPI003C130DE0
MTIGTEHEYSVNDAQFTALPVSDQIIKSICGSFASEILFGEVKLGKELQKTVLEFIPRVPASGPLALESMLMQGIRKFYHIFPTQYHLLGLGMHPTLTPGRTAVWDHDEGEYYEAYDRLFNIRQHGWLNIQALQVNLSYTGEKDLLMQYNRIRTLLPYIVALTASSPMVEGRLTGTMDNRLIYYRENQKEIPQICNGIIPARLRSVAEYQKAQEQIFTELRARDAEILCEEWLNSSGLIIRFSRGCLEIKAPDEQECIRSDMAVAALVTSLLRCPTLPVETDQDALLALTELAIQKGTADLGPELEALYRRAWQRATAEERQYLPVIENRITNGSLAEQMAERYRSENAIEPILANMAHCLRVNKPYGMG